MGILSKNFLRKIFSVGNPDEGYGLAMPRSMDDFNSKKISYDLELYIGK